MDVNEIMRYFEERMNIYSGLGSEQLVNSLNTNEYIDREAKKTSLFLKKLDFICLSETLKAAVKRETGYKQLKRYLKRYCDMDDTQAHISADKFNEASRLYKKFATVLSNCAQCCI